jgi:hypothetical protein
MTANNTSLIFVAPLAHAYHPTGCVKVLCEGICKCEVYLEVNIPQIFPEMELVFIPILCTDCWKIRTTILERNGLSLVSRSKRVPKLKQLSKVEGLDLHVLRSSYLSFYVYGDDSIISRITSMTPDREAV